jgi:trehalose utilization protein
MNRKIHVVVWNEFRHEKASAHVKAIYPDGLHATIKSFLDLQEDLEVTLAALDDECQGLPDELFKKPTCFSGGVTAITKKSAMNW